MTMNHIVLFRRKADAASSPQEEAALVERMATLDRQIDFVRGWRFSANELKRPACWDYVLESSFDDADAVNAYLVHPAHMALVGDLKKTFEWVACDYTVKA